MFLPAFDLHSFSTCLHSISRLVLSSAFFPLTIFISFKGEGGKHLYWFFFFRREKEGGGKSTGKTIIGQMWHVLMEWYVIKNTRLHNGTLSHLPSIKSAQKHNWRKKNFLKQPENEFGENKAPFFQRRRNPLENWKARVQYCIRLHLLAPTIWDKRHSI